MTLRFEVPGEPVWRSVVKILALDLATNTGWARNYGPYPRSGSVSFERPKATKKQQKVSVGFIFSAFDEWLSTQEIPDILVIEEPHLRGGAATKIAVGLWAVATAGAFNGGAEVISVRTRDLKISFTGYGNASKEDMIAMAKRRGYNPQNDDEADACLLLEYMKALKCP